MRTILIALAIFCTTCGKEEKEQATVGCDPTAATIRTITNKRATVQTSGGTAESVWLVEEGTIDTRLIPCNFPMEFYQSGLQVTISGEVKRLLNNGSPCCREGLVITSITR